MATAGSWRRGFARGVGIGWKFWRLFARRRRDGWKVGDQRTASLDAFDSIPTWRLTRLQLVQGVCA